MTASAYTSIFHPFDNSNESSSAFAHALQIAIAASSELRIMHISDKETEEEWHKFPGVRTTLSKWGLVGKDATRDQVTRLGIKVTKVLGSPSDPLQSLTMYVRDHRPDLMVLATHGYEGINRWIHKQVAEPLARKSQIPTLFVPMHSAGFVSSETGQSNLRHVLIPICQDPCPHVAIEAAVDLANTLKSDETTFTLLHVGNSAPANLPLPQKTGWTWLNLNKTGDVAQTILNSQKEIGAQLIVMATKGHDGIMDMLRGSTTERVMREATCPTLMTPNF